MKKLILTIFTVVVSGLLSLAQDDIAPTESSRSIHLALSPSTSALFGLHIGYLPDSEGLIGGNTLIESGGIYIAGRYNNRNIMNLDRISADIGVTLQMLKFAHVFIGGGYGEYKYPYKEPTVLPDKEIKGFEMEGGAIFRFGKITLHAGVSTLKFEHLDLLGGIGYVF